MPSRGLLQRWSLPLGAEGAGTECRCAAHEAAKSGDQPREQGRGTNLRSVGAGRPIHTWDYPRGRPVPALPFS